MEERPVVEAAPAATVVLLRDGDAGLEVLLERRSSRLDFHGGAWVFPGGRIDPEDYGDRPEDAEGAARRCAVREAKEEAGVDVDPDALVHLSSWTTPEIAPKRFATWFFVGPVAGGVEEADGTETDALRWFRPDEALAEHAAGSIELAPPQYVTLLDLRDFPTVAAALGAADAAEVFDYLPRMHVVDGRAVTLYNDDIAYDDPDAFDRPGPRHRLVFGARGYDDTGWAYIRESGA